MSLLTLSRPPAPSTPPSPVDFTLPRRHEATTPPERRGLARDGVRLLVSRPHSVSHGRFRDLPAHLRSGDLLVVNTSATLPAALDGSWRGREVVLHLSTRLDDVHWVVELRHPDQSGPIRDAVVGDRVELPGGAHADLLAPADARGAADGGARLWRAAVDVPVPARATWLRDHGRPIAYAHLDDHFSLEDHQTIFARHPGSAEMASAARPFTPRVVAELVTRGIGIAPITLHAGVSSLEAHEPPRPEWFRVPEATARMVTATREGGGRVIAVGTTATRALETRATRSREVRAGSGWTDLVLGPDRRARVVDGLVTGWHEPGASHLSLLEAVAGREQVARAYEAALAGPYLWHEFGDSCLLLP